MESTWMDEQTDGWGGWVDGRKDRWMDEWVKARYAQVFTTVLSQGLFKDYVGNLEAGFPGGSEVKVPACNAGDLGSIPESGRFPGEGNGNPL